MKTLYLTEIKKIFGAKTFVTLLAALSLITIFLGVGYSYYCMQYVHDIEAMSLDSNGYYASDPLAGAYTLYNTWIGGIPGTNLLTALFYYLLPLAAALPYGLSFMNERTTGYLRKMVLQKGKLNYYLVKYFAVFTSGFLIIFIPIALNIITTACFVPIYRPNILYAQYYTQSYGQYLSRIFYTFPLLFLIIFTLLPSIFGGLWATLSLCISYFVMSKYIVLFVPYVLLFFFAGFFEMLLTHINGINVETSPFYFLRGGYSHFQSNIILVITILLSIFILTFIITFIRGKHDDIY